MTVSVLRAGIVAAVALLLAACNDAPPPTRFPQLTYRHLGAITLDVAQLDIVDAYRPPLKAPNVEHRMPIAPAAAARQWAHDRLRTGGTSGRRAVFTIDNGAVTETPLKRQSGLRGALTVDQSERYDAMLAVRLEIFAADGRRLGIAEAQAHRSRSVPESVTLEAREKVWFALTESLINDLNAETEQAIARYLGTYLR